MNRACTHLSNSDPVLAGLIKRVGPCRLVVEHHELYQALIRAIAHQQLHAAAARTILGRFLALFPDADFPAPGDILSASDEAMRACGFSASKTASIRDIAAHAENGTIPTRRGAARLRDMELIERLTVIRGVGRWTVEMILMHTLGRPDVLPVDDFGIREGYRLLHALETQPRPRDLAVIGEAWAPYRSTAAWFLWRAVDLARTK